MRCPLSSGCVAGCLKNTNKSYCCNNQPMVLFFSHRNMREMEAGMGRQRDRKEAWQINANGQSFISPFLLRHHGCKDIIKILFLMPKIDF